MAQSIHGDEMTGGTFERATSKAITERQGTGEARGPWHLVDIHAHRPTLSSDKRALRPRLDFDLLADLRPGQWTRLR